MTRPYWETRPLARMTSAEWEALCDRCGRCCLNKLEDADTGELYYTNVACRYLDPETCTCDDYAGRASVAACLRVSLDRPEVFETLPDTCAYRLRYEGRPLPDWHPLCSGDPDSVHRAGISVRGKVVSEAYIHPDQLPEHVVTWIGTAKSTAD
ncbi:MAG TPA: YcgN family cysteine cluster protein [Chromatiales bacterium]|nr:YcgN family cysteine cluster protein [Chromatiales bacterium]